MQKKGEKVDFVKWFSEMNKDSGNIVGGKGANLSEIFNLGIDVPPGFVITAQAYRYFIEKSKLDKKIKKLLEKLDYEDTAKLNSITEEIRNLITSAKMPKEMEDEILESYNHLDTSNLDQNNYQALDILKSTEPVFVAVRSSATTEDLAEASFAGQQDSYLNIKGNSDLIKHIKKCFASLFTSRATYYRNKQGFKYEEANLAVVIQKMVDSEKSGVIFSKDPAYDNENIIMEAVWGLGEGIVSGLITPDKYVISRALEIKDKKIADKKIALTRNSAGEGIQVDLTESKSKRQVLKEYEIKKLAQIALELEKHYGLPQDIEFAIEREEIYIVQTRPITTLEKSVGEEKESKALSGEIILEGLAASPGIGVGKVKIINDLSDLPKIKEGDILVTTMTNPDMVVSMEKATAIVTNQGGLTAHAAIVSREMGIPAIVGTETGTSDLKENSIITVDGYTGKVYQGDVAGGTHKKEILPVTAKTKTKIKVIVDLPNFAKRAAKTNLTKVGLTRVEGIIAEGGKHPEYYLKNNKIDEYEELIYQGISKIVEHFSEVWVRTSDIRSDEYSNLKGAPKEIEANPMLGMHGIRYGIIHPELFKAELKGLKRAAKGKKVGILSPQVISVEEVQTLKKFLKEVQFNDAQVGVMVETPAAVQLIREICEEGIDFISFGTNDLTQYILAIDRGNEAVQHLYNEMHPAVLHQISYVIRVCKRLGVETSICGQAGSKKEMVKFLIEKGIDSITVNADVAKEISEYVYELEQEAIKGTDKEPRQYQPEEKTKKVQEN
jgi:pyruvate, water dikinase